MADDLSQYGTIAATGSPAATGGMDLSQYGMVQEASPARIPGVVEQVGTSLHNQAKGIFEMLHGLVDPEVAMKIGQGEVDAQVHEWQRAKENYAKGDYVGAMTGALGAAVPILGPFINQTAEKLATEGKRAEGVTDIAAPLIAGKIVSKIPDVAEGIGTARAVLSDPAVIRAGVKVLPKGPAMVSAYDTIKGAIDRAKGVETPPTPAEAAPAVPSGVDPAVWERLSPELQQQLRAKVAGQPVSSAPASAPLPPRDPSHYGIEPKAAAPAEELPPSSDIGVHGGVENTPEPAGPELTKKLQDALRKAKIDAGLDPDVPLGQVKGGRYTARFDNGDPNSPIIDSSKRKAYSTATPANPMRIADDFASISGPMDLKTFDRAVAGGTVQKILQKHYGVEADANLLAAIRRRIAKQNIGDLMKGTK